MEHHSTNRALALRALLRERFPSAHAVPIAPPSRQSPDADACAPQAGTAQQPILEFSPGEIQEVVAERPGCGGALLIGERLEQARRARRVLTLIDGRDSFDPDSFGPIICRRMLWLRCRDAEQALQSTDLLLRDGNLPEIVLDLQLNPLSELKSIPPSVWHRFRGLSEQSGAALLVITPSALVSSAHRRLALRPNGKEGHWDHPRSDFSASQRPELLRQRSYSGQTSVGTAPERGLAFHSIR